jgi:hypothetical protein
MLHILTKVKIIIMSIIESIRICNANSNESDIILIHFINKQIIKADYKHIFDILFIFYDDIKNITLFIYKSLKIIINIFL